MDSDFIWNVLFAISVISNCIMYWLTFRYYDKVKYEKGKAQGDISYLNSQINNLEAQLQKARRDREDVEIAWHIENNSEALEAMMDGLPLKERTEDTKRQLVKQMLYMLNDPRDCKKDNKENEYVN